MVVWTGVARVAAAAAAAVDDVLPCAAAEVAVAAGFFDGETLNGMEHDLGALWEELREEPGLFGFILTSTVAASRSWTCWCFDIRSLEVYDHAGSCSHLYFRNRKKKKKVAGGQQKCTCNLNESTGNREKKIKKR